MLEGDYRGDTEAVVVGLRPPTALAGPLVSLTRIPPRPSIEAPS